MNEPDSTMVVVGPSHAFPDLTLEQKRSQARLNEERRRFFALARALLRGQSDESRKRIEKYEQIVRDSVEQEYLVWWRSTGEALSAATAAVEAVLEAVNHLDDPADGSVVLVPDTNALLASPALQEWRFAEIPVFEVLLVPTILSELDSIKVGHRNVRVREKAQSIVRQIKEYSRRGLLVEGVPVVRDSIRVRASAREPRVDDTLPWLDASVPDDRILASTVEAMRAHPRSVVALVTGDINLQNKATFAGVTFLEPPEAGEAQVNC